MTAVLQVETLWVLKTDNERLLLKPPTRASLGADPTASPPPTPDPPTATASSAPRIVIGVEVEVIKRP